MKTLLATLAAVSSLAFTSSSPVSYAGNWTLDTAQSTNLPSYYSRVKSHKLSITQTDKMLDVVVVIDLGEGRLDSLDFPYRLDGTEAQTETKIRGPNGQVSVPTTLKAEGKPDGGVHISIDRTISMNGGTVRGLTVEDWKLEGNRLVVQRVDDTPRGKMEATMVFVKQS